MKKLIAVVLALCLCFAMSCVFAGSGEEAFVNAFAEGYNADALWSSLTPFVGIMLTSLIFAFAWGRFRKTGKASSRAKFNV